MKSSFIVQGMDMSADLAERVRELSERVLTVVLRLKLVEEELARMKQPPSMHCEVFPVMAAQPAYIHIHTHEDWIFGEEKDE